MRPLYSAVLAPGQCRFDDAGSACRIVVVGGTPACAALVGAFR